MKLVHGAVSLCLLVAGTLFGCSILDAAEDTVYKTDDFQLTLPKQFRVKKTIGPDFDQYSVQANEKPYVGIYFGNHPSFPSAQTGEQTKFVTADCEIYTYWEGHSFIGRQVLITTPHGKIHAWLSPDGGQELAIADKILMSIRAKP